MTVYDIVGISDRLADHDSLSTQCYFQDKQLSRVFTLVLDAFWSMRSQRSRRRDKGLLPFSKMLEKLFGIRLDSFIDRYNLLSSNQYGFRRNMSTSLALMELTEEITTALDDKKKSLWVSLLT